MGTAVSVTSDAKSSTTKIVGSPVMVALAASAALAMTETTLLNWGWRTRVEMYDETSAEMWETWVGRVSRSWGLRIGVGVGYLRRVDGLCGNGGGAGGGGDGEEGADEEELAVHGGGWLRYEVSPVCG